MMSAYCLMYSGIRWFLAVLTAVLVLEEVDWAGVGGQDQHHLVAHHPSDLKQNGDKEATQ